MKRGRGGKIVSSSTADAVAVDSVAGGTSKKKAKTTPKKTDDATTTVAYKKLDHREFVLLRPGVNVGSTDADVSSMWLMDTESQRMKLSTVSYVPAFTKIVDEILMNAIDHGTRIKTMLEQQRMSASSSDQQQQQTTTKLHPVKNIRVNVDKVSGFVEVTNDGEGIDVVQHDEETKVYIPELIFGHLLTSANYDDEEDTERVIGGQNGIGAKACNIFSKRFEVTTVDHKRGKLYKQAFTDNMSVVHPPVITSSKVKPYTSIRFLPDYARFGGDGDSTMTDDMYNIIVKRVYDATAVTDPDVTVHLNGTKIDCKSFERYVDYYIGPKSPASTGDRAFEKVGDRWEISAACSAEGNGGLQQVSFVNGVWTMRGGKHVDHVVNQIVRKLTELVQKRRTGSCAAATIRPQFIKDNLFVFVKACIPNPTFDSQSKEYLTTPVSKFGFSAGGARIEVSDRFVEKLYKSGIVDRIVALSEASSEKTLKASDGKKQSSVSDVPKLTDAIWAGGPKSASCTLILTEGDSAKTMAIGGIGGLPQEARNRYGVFPLRGKIMNVCDLDDAKIASNKEITNIKKIMGLESRREYQDVSSLRYGRIMIMTDQDTDGSHIKGLLFNVFYRLWPSLLRVPGFLTSMLTPVVKVSGKRGARREFYNMADYDAWLASDEGAGGRGWTIKYYKGLGTSTTSEAKEYFKALKTSTYVWTPESGGSADALELAFNKNRTNERKVWLQAYDKTAGLDFCADGDSAVTFEDFVNRDLVHFSNYDVVRSIPSMCDGMKVSQRKIVFSCIKRNLKSEIKVVQLAGYVSEHAMYHHGEASLNATIVNLAQDFVGTNNINLLMPNGQFGTRLQGGSDAAAPRYIHTQLNDLTGLLIHRDDTHLLNYQDCDGVRVEPDYYLPVLPLVLVNGANGIGTGFSTKIPCYDPMDLTAMLRQMLQGEDGEEGDIAQTWAEKLRPWYRGFKGTIEDVNGRFFSRGVVTRCPKGNEVVVSELPIGYWSEKFKEHVDALKERLPEIKAVRHNHSESEVCCTITFTTPLALEAFMCVEAGVAMEEDKAVRVPQTRIEKELKLVTGLPTTNMYLFNREGRIQKYDNVGHIAHDFYTVRLAAYGTRKLLMLSDLRRRLGVLKNKARFVQGVVDEVIVVQRKSKAELEAQLAEMGFDPDPEAEAVVEEHDHEDVTGARPNFEYIVRMPLYSLSSDKKRELDIQIEGMEQRIEQMESKTEKDLWRDDLAVFEEGYKKAYGCSIASS